MGNLLHSNLHKNIRFYIENEKAKQLIKLLSDMYRGAI